VGGGLVLHRGRLMRLKSKGGRIPGSILELILRDNQLIVFAWSAKQDPFKDRPAHVALLNRRGR